MPEKKISVFSKKFKIHFIFLTIIFIFVIGCRSLDLIIAGYQGKDIIQVSLFGTDNVNLKQLDKVQLKGFSIADFDNPQVRRFIKIYQTTGKKNLITILDRAYKYLPGIKKIFKEKGIPEDLAYLPIIESAFISKARSHKNATGLWQFMYHTGRMYGLENSYYYEDRADPYKSTIAAAYHLKYLYKKFNNWLLVLAAYNAGGGKVGRGIKKHKTESFWELCRKNYLKKETQNYVPKFIAATLIAKNPTKFGLPAPDPNKFIKVKNYNIEDATDINLLAKCSKVSPKEFKLLNPALLRWTTPPSEKFIIHIPEDNYEQFLTELKKIPLSERVTFRKYLIRLGDNLTTISKKFKVPISPIIKLNKIKTKNRISAGNTIMIPIKGLNKAKQIDKENINAYHTPKGKSIYTYLYNVKKGETLYSVARKCKIGIVELMNWNNIKDKNGIHPGDLLIIREYHNK